MTQKYTVEYIKELYNCNPALCNIIPFWKTYQKYGQFCQWWKSNFTDGTNTYICAEQYMMYKKAILFKDYDIAEKILKETVPANMQKYGRIIKNFDSNIWDKNKYEIVYTGNYLKFSQNSELKTILKNTAKSILVEASSYDKIWGIAMTEDNKNINDPNKWYSDVQNLLGFILMEVRDNL